jgi:hypothetical protein
MAQEMLAAEILMAIVSRRTLGLIAMQLPEKIETEQGSSSGGTV